MFFSTRHCLNCRRHYFWANFGYVVIWAAGRLIIAENEYSRANGVELAVETTRATNALTRPWICVWDGQGWIK